MYEIYAYAYDTYLLRITDTNWIVATEGNIHCNFYRFDNHDSAADLYLKTIEDRK